MCLPPHAQTGHEHLLLPFARSACTVPAMHVLTESIRAPPVQIQSVQLKSPHCPEVRLRKFRSLLPNGNAGASPRTSSRWLLRSTTSNNNRGAAAIYLHPDDSCCSLGQLPVNLCFIAFPQHTGTKDAQPIIAGVGAGALGPGAGAVLGAAMGAATHIWVLKLASQPSSIVQQAQAAQPLCMPCVTALSM